jgi:N-acyl-D-amino-acid deacylase
MTIQPALRDILFVSPTIINGDEDAIPFVSDVLVSGGRIAAIGKDLAASHSGDARRIEAKGLVLSPGFIDLVS